MCKDERLKETFKPLDQRQSLGLESYHVNSPYQHPFQRNSKVCSLNNVLDAIQNCLPYREPWREKERHSTEADPELSQMWCF